MKKRFLYVAFLIIALCVETHAASVVWPAVGLSIWGGICYDLGANLAEGGNVVVEILSPTTAPILSVYEERVTLGGGHFWYQTTLDTPVNAAAAASATPFASNFVGGWQPINLYVGQVFYLGFFLDVDYSMAPNSADIYGWSALLWDGTELSLVGSAAETTGAGICAGTYNAIPEPAAAGLLLAGLAFLAMRRRLRESGSALKTGFR